MKKTALAIVILVAPLFFFTSQVKSAEKHDLIISQLERFALSAQNPAMKGYDIRARRIVVPAGATIPEHDHATRSGIVYVQSGSIVEYRGKASRLLKAGDSLVEDVNTVHAYKNTSKEDCVLIAFDLPNTAKSN